MALNDRSDCIQGFFLEHPDNLVITDVNGAVLAINEAARRTLGPAITPGSPPAPTPTIARSSMQPSDRLAASQPERVACRLLRALAHSTSVGRRAHAADDRDGRQPPRRPRDG
jgi:hypothetical protein